MKGFDYRTQQPLDITPREFGKMKREIVAAGGTAKQVTTPEGKEVFLRLKGVSGIAVEVYL